MTFEPFGAFLGYYEPFWKSVNAVQRTPQEVMDKSEADELRQNVLGRALSLTAGWQGLDEGPD